MKKIKLIILISLIGFLGPCFSGQSFAQQAYGGVYITELKINEVKGNEVKGEFTAWNNEQHYLTNLNHVIKLFYGPSSGSGIIDAVVSGETFFIPPDGKITKSFAYKYPKNIADGEYFLRLQVVTQKGAELGWEDKIVALEGQGKFLDVVFPSAKLLFDKEERSALMGEIVSSDKKVTAVFKVKNSGEEITAIPKVRIFNRMYNMSLAEEQQYSAITFKKDETQEISLEMPNLDAPESYLAEVKLYQGQEQVSGIQYFRWVVEGRGGKILEVRTDKDYYKAGENMQISVVVVGPADFSDIGTGELKISVFDKNGNFLEETKENVALNPRGDLLKVNVLSQKDLFSPKVEVQLSKDGKILDQYKIEVPVFSNGAKELQKKDKIIKLTLLLLLFLIVLAVLFLVYKFRKYIPSFTLWRRK